MVTEDNTGSVYTPGTFLTGVCQIGTELPIALRLEQKNAVTIIRDNLDDKKLPIRGKFPIEYQTWIQSLTFIFLIFLIAPGG